MTVSGATDRVRQELGALPVDDRVEVVVAELGALLRAAGTLVRRQDGWGLELVTGTGAVARRAHHLVRAIGGEPIVFVREATNVARRTYGVVLEADQAGGIGRAVGLLDLEGRPCTTAPPDLEAHAAALVRGALLGAGSVSPPNREPHLELRTSHEDTAQQLARAVHALVGTTPSVGSTSTGHRATVKSRATIEALLAALGAANAAAAHAEQRQRRGLRGAAQRLANADAANVRRAVDAAGSQVQVVEQALEVAGWDGLGEDLREVALARLANPSASLAELGALCDPPVGKSAVHRRLGRLRAIVEDAGPG